MIPAATAEFYRSQQHRTVVTVALMRREWRLMGADFDRSWAKVGPRLTLLAGSSQLGAAHAAIAYVPKVLEETGQPDDPAAEVDPHGFSGVAADGRSLDGLLYGAVTTSKTAVGNGATPSQGLAVGGRWLDMVAQGIVADAGRVAAGVAVTARPRMGYVRMVNPPSCSRCAMLAGRWYRYSDGFSRHPRCFPAGVVVSGPRSLATTRRWYQGELVIITTASGKNLPTTGNHPVLTNRGWVPANLVQEGDDVVGSRLAQGARALVVPDEHEMPASVEDLWRARAVVPLLEVPTTTEDFHGDGLDGQVDVVLADRLLRDRLDSALGQPTAELALAGRSEGTGAFPALGLSAEEFVGRADATDGSMGGFGLSESLLRSHLSGAHLPGGAHAADLDALPQQTGADHARAHVVAEAEAVLALAAEVRRRDLGIGQDVTGPPRWDAPAGPLTVHSRAAYAGRGEDLRQRLASQVELDRVVEVRRVEWSGHVYNLTSAEGWYEANGLIVSNCDCTMIPSAEDVAGDFRTDPQALVSSGQVTDLRPAEAKALADGADLSQVVNARRGASGLNGLTTTEGTTAKGLAGQRLNGARRLTPEGIYARANSRDEALTLLRLHGYLI